MLNNVESNILEIFKNIYELKSTNFINENMPNFNIIFDNEHIPEKLVEKFLEKINKNLSYILEYALTYSLIFKLDNIVDIYKKSNINELNQLSYESKFEIIKCAIKYLISKKNDNLNKNNISKIKEDNIELFNKINNFNFIITLNKKYRDIINELLKKESNQIKLIENVLLNNNFDQDIINISNGIISSESDLKHFKLYITRIFLYDVYVFELYLKKDAMKNIPSNMIPSFLPDSLLDEIASTPIVEYIKECNNKNQYKLPTNEFLRHHMIGKYFAYQKKEKTEMILDAEKNHKEILKKVYPLYELDKIEV